MLLSDALMHAHMAALAAALDAGSGPGKLLAYTGPQPARGAAVTTQTLLGQSILSDPCGTVDGATLTLTDPAPWAFTAGGVIAWIRAVDSAGNFVGDLAAGLPDSTAEVRFSTLTVQAGAYMDWTAATLTYPGA